MVEADSERVVLGLTGGTGAGKPSALRAVESLGGQVIDCDQLYHEMLETCAPLRDDIGASFPGAFDADGQLDRRKLGQVHKDRLEQLNSIIFRHLVPEVRRRLASSENRLFAIDAINLLEGGLDQLCDRTVRSALLRWSCGSGGSWLGTASRSRRCAHLPADLRPAESITGASATVSWTPPRPSNWRPGSFSGG